MDFFGFSDAPELSTHIGVLVKSGTDPLLLGPDWAKNIEICDHINSHNNGADAVKAILHQLKSSDPKVVALTLTMFETCMKNCVSVPQNINRSFMDEMVNISTGRKGFDNQEDALRMIQMWGLTYERRRNELPLFFETYMALKTRGIRFPEPEDQPSSPSPRGHSVPARDSSLSSSVDVAACTQGDDSAKLRNDLGVVLEKVRLCREMLPQSPGIHQDEILAEVIGFLEACQERMFDLIEAGTQGLLIEDVFELCLRVNDAVLRTLEAEKNGTPIPVDDDTTVVVAGQASEASGKTDGSGGIAAAPNQLKAVQMDDDEEADLFSALSMKPAKVVGAPSGTKKVPTLKPPAQSGGSKVFFPPPPPSSFQQAAAAPVGGEGRGVDILDFLSTSPASSTPVAAPAAPAAPSSTAANDFESLFDMSTSPPPPAAPPASSSAGMTDDEFENFLNTVGPADK